jgi:hypothetical protein
MVKLYPSHRKLPAKKVVIYLLLVMALIALLIGWNRISLIFQAFFPIFN